jgi:hypothetical protein
MDEDDIVTEFRRFEEAPESEKPRIVDEQIAMQMPSPLAVDHELLLHTDQFWSWFTYVSVAKEAAAGDARAIRTLRVLQSGRVPPWFAGFAAARRQ